MTRSGSLFSAMLSRLRIAEDDARGKRFVAVIECILNQNARDHGAAVYPAANAAVLELCARHGVGLLQMACPEIRALGFKRERPAGTRIRDCLDTPSGRQSCRAIADEVVERVSTYLEQGVELLAILGGNPESPGCAVHPSASNKGCLDASSGILMRELADTLAAASIHVPFRGIRDGSPALLAEDLRWLEALFRLSAKDSDSVE